MKATLPLLLAISFTTALCAQNIPTGDFEDWTNAGDYLDPTGWLTSNMVSFPC